MSALQDYIQDNHSNNEHFGFTGFESGWQRKLKKEEKLQIAWEDTQIDLNLLISRRLLLHTWSVNHNLIIKLSNASRCSMWISLTSQIASKKLHSNISMRILNIHLHTWLLQSIMYLCPVFYCQNFRTRYFSPPHVVFSKSCILQRNSSLLVDSGGEWEACKMSQHHKHRGLQMCKW